jgi:phage terminase large subunit
MEEHRAGRLKMIKSEFQDNPLLWDAEKNEWTKEGDRYVNQVLANLTGTLKERFYYGKWVTAEGQIYTEFDPEVHVVDNTVIRPYWDRYVTIDFGFTAPFTAQWWAVDDDGRMYLYRELYGTQRIVEDWAHMIYELSKEETIRAYICDHDRQAQVTLERHAAHDETQCYLGREDHYEKVKDLKAIGTVPANKKIDPSVGIGYIKSRMRLAGDGKPRWYICKDTLVEQDDQLAMAKKPTQMREEIPVYVWDKVQGRLGERTLDKPKKQNDHGMDAMRYLAVHLEHPEEAQAPDNNTDILQFFGMQVPRSYGSNSKR